MGWAANRRLKKRVGALSDVMYPRGGVLRTKLTIPEVLDLFAPYRPIGQPDGSFRAAFKDGSAGCRFTLAAVGPQVDVRILESEKMDKGFDVMEFMLVATLVERVATLDLEAAVP